MKSINLPKVVAKLRYDYHLTLLDLNNVAYQLKLRKDEKAEEIGKKHCMAALDALSILSGFDSVDKMFEKLINDGMKKDLGL